LRPRAPLDSLDPQGQLAKRVNKSAMLNDPQAAIRIAFIRAVAMVLGYNPHTR